MYQCIICREDKPVDEFVDRGTVKVCLACMEEHQFEPEDLGVFREHLGADSVPAQEGAPGQAAPSQATAAELDQLPHAVATETQVACPNPQCPETFEINPWFYGSVAECPKCGSRFVIEAPDTSSAWKEALPPGDPARTTQSNIKKGLRSRDELPAALDMSISPARNKMIRCPKCHTAFPASPDVYGATVQCSECDCEFKVDPLPK